MYMLACTAAGVYGGCVCSTQRIRWVRVQYTAAAGRAAGHAYDVRLGERWAAAQRMARRDQGLQASHMYGGGGVHVYNVQQGKRWWVTAVHRACRVPCMCHTCATCAAAGRSRLACGEACGG